MERYVVSREKPSPEITRIRHPNIDQRSHLSPPGNVPIVGKSTLPADLQVNLRQSAQQTLDKWPEPTRISECDISPTGRGGARIGDPTCVSTYRRGIGMCCYRRSSICINCPIRRRGERSRREGRRSLVGWLSSTSEPGNDRQGPLSSACHSAGGAVGKRSATGTASSKEADNRWRWFGHRSAKSRYFRLRQSIRSWANDCILPKSSQQEVNWH